MYSERATGNAVTALLTDVLTLDKMEQGQFELDIKAACLECLLVDVTRPFAIAAKARHLRFRVRQGQSGSVFQADPASQPRGSKHVSEGFHGEYAAAVAAREPVVCDALPSSVCTVERVVPDTSESRWIDDDGRAHAELKRGYAGITHTGVDDPPELTDRSSHSNLAMMAVDPVRVQQILRNLLSNALKFTMRGSVSVHLRYGRDMVDISVQDTGIGMDQASLDRLFMPYVQFASDLHKGQGSGLGLSIAKRLAQLHDGDLTCESAVELGSTFSLRFPYRASISAIGTTAAGTERASSSAVDGSVFAGASTSISTRHINRSIMSGGTGASSSEEIVHIANDVNADHLTLSAHSSPTSTPALQLCTPALITAQRVLRSAGAAGSSSESGTLRGIAICQRSLADIGSSTRSEHVAAPSSDSALADAYGTAPVGRTPLSVLVVDDTELNARLLCRLLERRGWISQKASNGQIAVDRVTSGQHFFDLVFMDLNMPIMAGDEAVRRIRASGFGGYIVGLTGDASRESVNLMLQAGADTVMSKPIDVKLLDDLLARLSAPQADACATDALSSSRKRQA